MTGGRVLCLLGVALAAAALHAQTPDAKLAVLRGRVVADEGKQPLRNARVTVIPDGPAAVLTDAEGRFTIAAAAGRQRVMASKSGYASGAALAADGVEIRLARGGVIAGRVVDDRGAPAAMVAVAADAIGGGDRRVPSPTHAAVVDTDDRGEYRLYGLAAGDYTVFIFGARRGIAFRPAFYPDAPLPWQAEPIRLTAGEEVDGIDLTLRSMPNQSRIPPANASAPTMSVRDVPPPSEPGPPGTVRGRVVGPDGLPLARVRVQLESSERLFSPDSVQADEDGWYAFHGVAPGDYLLTAEMPGYRRTVGGQRTPWERGDLATMAADRAEVRVDLAMRPGDAIVGRVVDEYGDPVANVAVSASAIRVISGRRQLVGVPREPFQPVRTDDRGRYRLFAMPPGEFVVAAAAATSRPDLDPPVIDLPGYARTYYPATPVAAEAAVVEVVEGQDRLNVDITLVKGGTTRVAGRVVTASGEPASATVSIGPSYRSGAIATGVRSMRADGRFEFTDVPPGEYVVQAATPRVSPSIEGEFASRFVTVNGVDVADVVLAMAAGSTIAGRVVFEDADAPPASDSFELSPIASDPDAASLATDPVARADLSDDWTFAMGGVAGSRRLRVTRAPEGWMLKAILASGLDVTDRPLLFGSANQSLSDVTVVMTSKLTALTGMIADDNGAPLKDAAIVAFACDDERRYPGSRFVVSANASRAGSFTVNGLAPAEYFVAAVARRRVGDLANELDNPRFLESLVAGAARLTVGEGQAVAVTLRAPAR